MHSDAAGEGVVNGDPLDVGGGIVAPLLIHVSIHVEVDGVMAHQLLPHVLHLHPINVDSLEPVFYLGITVNTIIPISALEGSRADVTKVNRNCAGGVCLGALCARLFLKLLPVLMLWLRN